MTIVRLRSPGGLSNLYVTAGPMAAEPGPGEIRVKLQASSLNAHDLGVVTRPGWQADGRVPMSDGAGVVDAVGPGVTAFAAGDAVVSCFFPTWADGPATIGDFATVPGDGVDGYARETVTAPAAAFTCAPKGYSHAEAATLTTAGLTAWRALVVEGGLKAGDTVLVLGTGGVSIFALQIAKAMGARVIATSSSDAKLERARSLGADHGINYKTHADWGALARDWTGGRGVDHVIEVGGPATLAQSIAAVRVGGHIALIGVLTGRSGDVPTAGADGQTGPSSRPHRRQPAPPDRLCPGHRRHGPETHHRPQLPPRGHRRRLPISAKRRPLRQDLPGVVRRSSRVLQEAVKKDRVITLRPP